MVDEQAKTIISIDPGAVSPSGWAVLTVEHSPRLVAVGQVKLSDETATEALAKIWGILDELGAPHPGLAVVESAYLSKNVRTTIMLGRAFGRWQEACVTLGLAVDEAQASQWQTAELVGRSRRAQRTTRTTRKALAISKASGIWGGNTWTEHEADAALMGRWAAIRSLFNGKS